MTSLEPGRLFDRKIGGLGAAQQLGELSGHDLPIDLDYARPVSNEATLLCCFRPLIHGWQTQDRNALQDELAMGEQESPADLKLVGKCRDSARSSKGSSTRIADDNTHNVAEFQCGAKIS